LTTEKLSVNLEALRQEILADLQVCRKCRMCVSMCPTFEGWFTQSSMGRLTAINLHLKYGLGDEKQLWDLLYACTSCRRCRQRCRNASMGVSPADIILKTREYLVRRTRAQENDKE
jgi:Fe-S oxidoreductase